MVKPSIKISSEWQKKILIHAKTRISHFARMVNGTPPDTFLSDISPLSSTLCVIWKQVHRVVLSLHQNKRQTDSQMGERKWKKGKCFYTSCYPEKWYIYRKGGRSKMPKPLGTHVASSFHKTPVGQLLMTPLLCLRVFSRPNLTKEWDDQRSCVWHRLCVFGWKVFSCFF